jgi:uncharacterized protein (TIGR02118 family)
VSYPRTAGKKFDFAYYRNHHMPLVKDRLSPLKVEIDAGIPNHQGEPSPYFAVGHMTFESMEQLVARYGAAANELRADIPNYTDVEPIVQISEIIEI